MTKNRTDNPFNPRNRDQTRSKNSPSRAEFLKRTIFLANLAAILIKSANSFKLIMTVTGGPYDSLSPGSGQNMVLYGDRYDRGYKYNAKSNKNLNKYEDGHTGGAWIEGIVEHPETKIVATAGNDGSVCFWDPDTNKTIQKFKNIGGNNESLTDMILTRNDILVLAIEKPKENLAYLPFSSRKTRKFVLFEGGHEEGVSVIRAMQGIPMFLSVSPKKIIRWFSDDPPRKITEYTGADFVDADAGFGIRILFIGKTDGSVEIRNLTSGKILKTKKTVFSKGGVKSVIFLPFLNQFACSGDSLVKIFDKELKMVKKLNDSKFEVSKLMYKQDDMIIGVINKKGIAFWKECLIKNCLACKSDQNDKNVCVKCRVGYSPNSEGTCSALGSDESPITWKFTYSNIDRDRFKVKFFNISRELMEKVNLYKPGEIAKLTLESGDEKEPKRKPGSYLKVKYEKDALNREWRLFCKFQVGFGLRNLSLAMINQTLKERIRILESEEKINKIKNLESKGQKSNRESNTLSYQPSYKQDLSPGSLTQTPKIRNQPEIENRRILAKSGIFFAGDPQSIPIPSMPAVALDLFSIFLIVGYVFRAILWIVLLFILFDIFVRLVKSIPLYSFVLARYIIVYYGLTMLILLNINYRPVVTECFRAYFHATHIGYYFFGERIWDPLSLNSEFFMNKSKVTDYGTNLIIIDRMTYEFIAYAVFLALSILTLPTGIFGFFNCLRFLTGLTLFVNNFYSGTLFLLNSWTKGVNTHYLSINWWVAVAVLAISGIELLYLVTTGITYLTQDPSSPHGPEVIDAQKLGQSDLSSQGKSAEPEKADENEAGRPANGSDDRTIRADRDLDDEKINSSKTKKGGKAHTDDSPKVKKKSAFQQFYVDPKIHYEDLEKKKNRGNADTNGSKVGNEEDLITDQVVEAKPDILSLGRVCQEIALSYTKPKTQSILPKLYNTVSFLRFCGYIPIVMFLDYNRLLQASVVAGANFLLFILSTISLGTASSIIPFLEELLLVFLSAILVVNAYDDLHPSWDLTAFWVISILHLVFFFLIMLLEMVLVLQALPNICFNLSGGLESSGTSDRGLNYVQQGFDRDNNPLPTEERGLNYTDIIQKGLDRSNVKGGSRGGSKQGSRTKNILKTKK